MRILVLGGTVFLSRAVAEEARRRGHDVVCACRGTSGSVPDGARLVAWDRSIDPPPVEAVGQVDAVVDVGRRPSWTRAAVAAWPEAHWSFVSTVNVYADEALTGQTPATGALVEARHDDIELTEDPAAYGAMKVGCEEAVRAGARASFVVRPGLIVGPGDPTGRGSYWPERLTEPGPVLAPGSPADVVQVIDARDLASWIVTAAEQDLSGTFDGVGLPTPLGALLTTYGADPASLVWVPSEALEALGVEPWMGPEAVPLWLPRPAYDGMMAHDVAPSLDAGLVLRDPAETARDTVAWLRATPDAARTGISREREGEVLARYATRG